MTSRGNVPPEEWAQFRNALKRNGFSPIGNIDAKRCNSKTQIIVERDGSMRERVHLQVADSAHREQLVCLHYLRHYARCYLTKDADGLLPEGVGVEFLSRDAPWDFEVSLSTGERFFIEITAVGDNRHQLEREKREERMLLAADKRMIRVRDLRKLASFFHCATSDATLALHAETPADLVVQNPFFGEGQRLITGVAVPPEKPLRAQIIAAVDRKTAKGHPHKDQTTLILDYRSNYAQFDATKGVYTELESYFGACPFPDVLLYVGYSSDDNGNNAEFSFMPLKVTADKAERLMELYAERGVDDFGRMVW